MSEAPIRTADARLLAPNAVRRVKLLGGLDDWAEALARVGVDVVDEQADLVVADARHARSAARVGAAAVLVLAPRRSALKRAGYTTRTVLVRRGPSAPRLFVPVDATRAARHALLADVPGRSAMKRLAIRTVLAALRVGVPVRGAITLGTRTKEPPRIIREAVGPDAAPGVDWYLLTGEGDDLQRLVWFCFGRGPEPEWVVKCGRVPGHDESFIRDEMALRSLDELPAHLRRHAPRLADRLDIDGLPAAVETAAPGQSLHVLLQHGPEEHGDLVGRIADWIAEVEAASALPPDELDTERARLRDAYGSLVDALPHVPAVLQHNDLGCWNVVVREGDFTVVDWESSRRAGLPLWDLLYFLTDALTSGPEEGKNDRVIALLRGELQQSSTLFARIRAAAARLNVPEPAVGPIATLAWLHHGRSAHVRAETGSARGAHARAPSAAGPLQQVASYWLTDPVLGAGWNAFSNA